jgi:hypothetical protein
VFFLIKVLSLPIWLPFKIFLEIAKHPAAAGTTGTAASPHQLAGLSVLPDPTQRRLDSTSSQADRLYAVTTSGKSNLGKKGGKHERAEHLGRCHYLRGRSNSDFDRMR